MVSRLNVLVMGRVDTGFSALYDRIVEWLMIFNVQNVGLDFGLEAGGSL